MTTFSEAVARVGTIQTLAELKGLVLELSVTASGSNALLYSGQLAPGQWAWESAKAVADRLGLDEIGRAHV